MRRQFIFGCAMLAAATPVFAVSDDNTDSLRVQLEKLKQKVEQLEQRLDQQSAKTQKTASRKKGGNETGAKPGANKGRNGLQVLFGVGEARGQKLKSQAAKNNSNPKKQVTKKKLRKKNTRKLHIGGALRYNYTVSDFNNSQANKNLRDRGGDINLDTFRINADAQIDSLLFSAEYRFYDSFRTIHHGWVGYRFADDSQVEIGVTKVPFGLLPYASNNFFFSSNYYLGWEDDYDAGIKYNGSRGNVHYSIAFFKNDEKNSSTADRYSFDPTNLPINPRARADDPGTAVDELGDRIQQTNTTNLRLAYTIQHAKGYTTEVGASGQYGQIYNNTRNENFGHSEAYALHLDGKYGHLEIMLESVRYKYALDGGQDTIGAAAYASNYPFAAEADTYLGNISYKVPLDFGPFDSIKFYNDYSYVGNKAGGFANTWQNATGAGLTAGNLFTYFDLVNAKNEPFIGGIMTGDEDEVETRFNINMGYYF